MKKLTSLKSFKSSALSKNEMYKISGGWITRGTDLTYGSDRYWRLGKPNDHENDD